MGNRVTVNCPEGSSRTKQSFRDQVNINTIIKKHRRTGMIRHLNAKKPFYGDVSHITDYQTALETVKNAENLFMNMSSEIRERFQNDPQQMIDFLNNVDNREEAIKLGMVLKKPENDEQNDEKPVEEPEKT